MFEMKLEAAVMSFSPLPREIILRASRRLLDQQPRLMGKRH
jgi:hypothetical protein